MPQDPKTETIQTPNGPITATTKTVDPTPQTIELVSSEQVIAINALASRAKSFAAAYLPGTANPSLSDFDEAFRLWQRDEKPRYTEQQVIEVLGAHLGNQLIADFQMEWVTVSDQYGTDYAVRAVKYEVMSFPFSSVAKRIESTQYDFMAGIYHTIKHAIASGEYKTR
jgi:hypothetical protein